MVGLKQFKMKNILLIFMICFSLNTMGQTILKDKKQELRIERVIQNSEPTYKIYYHTSYLVVGNKAMMDLFLEELLSSISNQKTYYTYIGNTSVRYTPFENEIEISAKSSTFKLNEKQIKKLKTKLWKQ
jgi:hypothetical protein